MDFIKTIPNDVLIIGTLGVILLIIIIRGLLVFFNDDDDTCGYCSYFNQDHIKIKMNKKVKKLIKDQEVNIDYMLTGRCTNNTIHRTVVRMDTPKCHQFKKHKELE